MIGFSSWISSTVRPNRDAIADRVSPALITYVSPGIGTRSNVGAAHVAADSLVPELGDDEPDSMVDGLPSVDDPPVVDELPPVEPLELDPPWK